MNYNPSSRASTFSGLGYSGGSSTGSSAAYIHAAQTCVQRAETCADLLSETLVDLKSSLSDSDRLIKIMQNSRMFVLVDEPYLNQVQTKVAEEISPQIEKLITQGEKAINNLEKLEGSLKTKVDMLKARAATAAAGDKNVGAPLQVRNEHRKAQMLLKQQTVLEKELASLQEEIDDLELQVISLPRAKTGPRTLVGRKR
ncbi:hypothetical protein FRC02_001494 [Tulasnella sp. 418]|nr:hypothetical protein FRC02_001494 [Tulasnella sp. 418]